MVVDDMLSTADDRAFGHGGFVDGQDRRSSFRVGPMKFIQRNFARHQIGVMCDSGD